jgi:hypothetical protein
VIQVLALTTQGGNHMAACESTIDINGTLKIPAAKLPVSCILQTPPSGITIVEAEFFPSGSAKPTSYPVTAGLSFSIPSLPSGTIGNLFVRIIGNWNGKTPIWVVEDCDNQAPIIAINSRVQKFGHTALEVV